MVAKKRSTKATRSKRSAPSNSGPLKGKPKAPGSGTKKPAPPSVYSEKLFDVICDRIEAGEAIRNICKEPGMPTKKNFNVWLSKYEYAGVQYARAREAQADNFAEQIREISDAPLDVSIGDDGKVKTDVMRLELEKRRQQIDARKWTASKLNPKKYSDKLAHVGPDDGPIQTQEVSPYDKILRKLDGLNAREGTAKDT